MLEPWNIVTFRFVFEWSGYRRVDFAFFINRKQNGAIKTMMFGKDFCQHRHRLFTAIFLISRNENNVPALTLAFCP